MNFDEVTNSIIDIVKTLTEKYPDRLVGKENTLQCAEELKQKLQDHTDHVYTQDFSVHPGSFLGWIRITVVLYIIALIFLWLQFWLFAFIISSIFVGIFVFQFVFFGTILDPFYKKKTGRNVIGIVEPEKEVKQQFIVSGHHDSAHIFHFFEKHPEWYPIRVGGAMLGILGMFFYTLISIVLYFITGIPDWYIITGKWGFLILLPFIINLWFFYSKKGTPGAGDNLASSLIAVEIAKYFYQQKQKGKGLQHTRVIAISFDGEEAGLRGARAYVKKYKNQLKSIPTYMYNLELLYNKDELAFTITDINDTIKLNEKFVDEGVSIARQLGYDHVIKMKFGFMNGGTDTGEFAKIGIDATTFQGMRVSLNHRSPAYHTLKDTYDSIDKEAVKAALKIGVHWIQKKDSGSKTN